MRRLERRLMDATGDKFKPGRTWDLALQRKLERKRERELERELVRAPRRTSPSRLRLWLRRCWRMHECNCLSAYFGYIFLRLIAIAVIIAYTVLIVFSFILINEVQGFIAIFGAYLPYLGSGAVWEWTGKKMAQLWKECFYDTAKEK